MGVFPGQYISIFCLAILQTLDLTPLVLLHRQDPINFNKSAVVAWPPCHLLG